MRNGLNMMQSFASADSVLKYDLTVEGKEIAGSEHGDDRVVSTWVVALADGMHQVSVFASTVMH
jgi:hypothetical protein